jgi:uncharacterized short protein YbdD (DUF466 family)
MSDRGEMLRRAAEAKRRLEQQRKANEAINKLKRGINEGAKQTCSYDNCTYVIPNYAKYREHLRKVHPDGEHK